MVQHPEKGLNGKIRKPGALNLFTGKFTVLLLVDRVVIVFYKYCKPIVISSVH